MSAGTFKANDAVVANEELSTNDAVDENEDERAYEALSANEAVSAYEALFIDPVMAPEISTADPDKIIFLSPIWLLPVLI